MRRVHPARVTAAVAAALELAIAGDQDSIVEPAWHVIVPCSLAAYYGSAWPARSARAPTGRPLREQLGVVRAEHFGLAAHARDGWST